MQLLDVFLTPERLHRRHQHGEARSLYARDSEPRQLNWWRSPTPRLSKRGCQLRLSVPLQFTPHVTSANLVVEVVKKLSATARLAFSELDPG